MLRLLTLLLLAGGAVAQPAGLIQNIPGRKTVSFDGSWQTIVDPFEVGAYDYRWQANPEAGFGANLVADSGVAQPARVELAGGSVWDRLEGRPQPVKRICLTLKR